MRSERPECGDWKCYRIDTFIGAPPAGRLTTMPTGRGMVLVVGVMLSRWAMRAIIRVSSIWASAKPMQLRAPRPNGTQAMSARIFWSSEGDRNRSRLKRRGSFQARGSRPA